MAEPQASQAAASARPQKRLSLIPRAYLILYNLVQFCGWSYAYGLLVAQFVRKNNLEGGLDAAGEVVGRFQLLSALEILHAAVGLVGGSPTTAAMQWAGRSNVLFGVIRAVPETQNRPAVGVMFLAWALSEMIRYPWYATSLMGICPDWLTWLRYSAFLILYPMGVACEIRAMHEAIPFIKQRGLRSLAMPNPANISFSYATFLEVLLWVYPFLWFRLFAFLLKQRKKKLGDDEIAADKKED